MSDLPTQQDFDDFGAWSGRDVVGSGGDRLGAVGEIYLDEATGVPEWVLVSLEDGSAFVPLAGASVEGQSVRVAQDAERVAAAPRPEVGETLSVADEKRLYEHYGLQYSQVESSTVLPEGAERPRLRKHIGAPVAAPAAQEEPAPAAESMAPRNLSTATPSALPPPGPQVIPPEGGFLYEIEESRGSKLRTAMPIVLASAIAGLIAVLAYRRRR